MHAIENNETMKMKFDSGDYLGRKRNLGDGEQNYPEDKMKKTVFIVGKPQEELNGLMNKTKQNNTIKQNLKLQSTIYTVVFLYNEKIKGQKSIH